MPSAVDLECVVVGAGIIGLAIARALAAAGREVFVLEAESAIGQGISARHSEVIHAGLYYRPGSAKAEYCIEGKKALYAFCEQRRVAHERCGKIIVATAKEQVDLLDAIRSRAEACGVHDLVALSSADLEGLEPELCGSAGLFSPSTGIVDSHALIKTLEEDVNAAGGQIVLATPVIGGSSLFPNAIELAIGGTDPTTIKARHVILAAGLFSTKIATSIDGVVRSAIPRTFFSKGNYFALRCRSPFARLVYPLPEEGGLGIHFTKDLAGRARFGPDVEWLKVEDPTEIDYRVDAFRKAFFADAIRKYWPRLEDDDLEPAYSGVRPKLAAAGEPDADFVISTSDTHGVEGLIALFGIESPGLTSAFAIAAQVARMVEEDTSRRAQNRLS